MVAAASESATGSGLGMPSDGEGVTERVEVGRAIILLSGLTAEFVLR